MSNLTTMSDYELVNLYGTGMNEAFDVLLSRHQSRLFAYILRLVQEENRANDVFQDTFIKAITYMRSGKFANTGKFSAWLMRIAHNIVVDSTRGSKSMPYLSEDTQNDKLYNNQDMSVESCEVELFQQSDAELISRLIDKLPKPQQEIVHLRFYEGLSFKEIALISGVSINTALGRMRYALMNMRKLISQYSLDLAV